MKDTIDTYINSIRAEFPQYNNIERRFIEDFSLTVSDYASCHPFTYNSLVKRFGTPKQVADNFYSSLTYKQCVGIVKNYRLSKRILAVTIALCTVAILIAGYIFFNIPSKEYNSKDYYTTKSTTIILETR